MYSGDLGGLDRWLGNVKCEHGGQSCEGEQSREPGELAERTPPESPPRRDQGEKQEAGPRLAQSEKYGKPARVESPYGRNQEAPRRECNQTLVSHMRECWVPYCRSKPEVAVKFITSVTRKPKVEPITRSIHGSGLRGAAARATGAAGR